MKVLSFGLDSSVLNRESLLAGRVVEYGELVEKYTVAAPGLKDEEISLSGRVRIYGVGGCCRIWKLLKIYFRAKKILQAEKYDVLTVQDSYYLALIGWRLAEKFNIGLELQIHGFEKFVGLRKLIAKFIVPRADAIRTVSQRLKKQLIEEFGVAEGKITVVPIYVESRIKNYELRIKNNSEKFIFLTVGRLVPVKNISLQIEAMQEVVKKYPGAELWIIGDGPERKNYELRITNYELGKNIKLLGRKDNLDEYYNSADAFLLTSNSEGWGLSVIEAAAHGLPIIMTDVGLAGEVIKNNESGLVIPVGDKEKLIEAMEKIIIDKNLRKRLGSGAQAAIKKLLSKEKTLELYKKSWQKAAVKL